MSEENKKAVYRSTAVIPGVIRISDAPFYLGMNKNIFRKTVSPFLTKFPVGGIGIGVARIELDLWIDYMKKTKGKRKKTPPWEISNESLPSESHEQNSGLSATYSRKRGAMHFQKLVKSITSKKQD